MAQVTPDFLVTYAMMSDDEVLRIAADKSSLVPEASAALEAEMTKRGITAGESAPGMPPPVSDQPKQEKEPPKSSRWLRGLIFLGWCVASIAFLIAVFTSRMSGDAVGNFSEAVTTMCLKGSLGLWVLSELLGARKLTIKGVLILSAIIYVVGIGGFSLYLLWRDEMPH
jgi:hypothetical protein